MSFSLPLQALGTFQLIIRIPGNGATMRPSFELKSLPASKLLRGVSCNTLTSSSIHFEVVEEGDGSGLTLAVSKEPEQIHWESIPGTPSAQHQVLHNYLETDNTMFNQDSRHVSLMGSENIALEKDSSDAGNFDMASFMLPTPPRECAPGTVADMSIFGTQHPSSFADSLIPQLSHPADMCGSDVYASSSGSPQSPPSLELPTSV
ncbi:hypothetical protein VNI00_003113 [Paramarasmius palmivorus]|uniref:Uncharacterized protein n=1 Tax=Paramarasmius palmivorus TaxID=297713 RepID=A0AAW0DRM4_9AGAR